MAMDHEDKKPESTGWGALSESKGTQAVGMPTFFNILDSSSILAQNNNIVEMKDIVKSLKDTLEEQKDVTSIPNSIGCIPTVELMNSDQSPNLPGIILKTIVGKEAFLMPILFYKDGAADISDTIYLGNNMPPFSSKKVAEQYMTPEIWTRISNYFTRVGSDIMSKVIPISCLVVNIDVYARKAPNLDETVNAIKYDIIREWYAGIWNMTAREVVSKPGLAFPNPFKDGKLFGKDETSIATIEVVPPYYSVNHKPVPWNLQVRLSTSNKNNQYGQPNQNSKTISTTFLNVSLDTMTEQQYLMARQQSNSPMVVGPLVPIVSVGETLPGEQLRNQTSILSQMLGVYAAIATNDPMYFSEAFRGAEVGARGNLVNLAPIAYRASGQPPINNAMILTEKNITDAATVNSFLSSYVSARALYVIDVPSNVGGVSNNDMWWGLVRTKQSKDSVYYRSFMTVLNVLTNGNWAKIIQENAQKGNNRHPLDWIEGDNIITPTNIMLPGGIGQGRNGQWIDLREVDLMFLSDKAVLGGKEQLIHEYYANINGTGTNDLRIRQYNVKRILSAEVFKGNVEVDSWYSRMIFPDAFLATFARAMNGSGNISVNSPAQNFSSMWQFRTSNPYLNNVASATLNTGMAQSGGFIGNTYSNWNQ